MLKPRFSFLSVLVMITITSAATYFATRFNGAGFEISAGIPFKWYFWTDVQSLDHKSFRWGFALFDLFFWLPVVLVSGLAVERLLSRRGT